LKNALTILVVMLGMLCATTPLVSPASTQDDQYLAMLVQRGIPIPSSSRAEAIDLAHTTVQKITADSSDNGIAMVATRLWQIAQQDFGLYNTTTPTADQFTRAVLSSAAAVYSPDLMPVVNHWLSNHPPKPPCVNNDPALAPWGGSCPAQPFGPYLR
jgi:hypothetical protein